jgi:hypothetical protein
MNDNIHDEDPRDQKYEPGGELSPWAEAIGPVFSKRGIANALGWTEGQLDAAEERKELISLPTANGERFYPTPQVKEQKIIVGLDWVVSQLDKIMNRYDQCAWLNQAHTSLNGDSIWTRMRSAESELPQEVEELVETLRDAWSRE